MIVDRARSAAPAERLLRLAGPFREQVRRLRRPGAPNLILGGVAREQVPSRPDPDRPARGDDRWGAAPLVAIAPDARVLAADAVDAPQAFATLGREVSARRRHGGSSRTGVAAIVSFEAGRVGLLGPPAPTGPPRLADPSPAVAIWRVDRSVCWRAPGDAVLTMVDGDAGAVDGLVDAIHRKVERADDPSPMARASGRPATSLPREAYLGAVERILRHVRRGDIYQANLCQRFAVPVVGDVFEWHCEQTERFPAPRSAWAELPGVSLASASPETFLRIDPDGSIETWPIKGTRPRADTPSADARVARDLLASEKDRAELLMIVDLERNDLGRLCRVGSVDVPELAVLRSYATVHHLVARVTGSLAGELDVAALLQATFPGGSISGAPKRRALELLADIEPVPRGWFTGSLFWFGDDGSVDSSILIRSPVFAAGHAFIGAGGGIVADSDPLAEWHEANLKARAAARLLGFDPEQAE